MNVDPSDISVRDNPEAGRFEARVQGQVAVAEYRRTDGQIVFTHTEVPPELQGQGVGSELVRYALEQAREQGLRVVPECAFVAGYIREHPEYRELTSEG